MNPPTLPLEAARACAMAQAPVPYLRFYSATSAGRHVPGPETRQRQRQAAVHGTQSVRHPCPSSARGHVIRGM